MGKWEERAFVCAVVMLCAVLLMLASAAFLLTVRLWTTAA